MKSKALYLLLSFFLCSLFSYAQPSIITVEMADTSIQYPLTYKQLDSLESGVLKAYYAFDTSRIAYVKYFAYGKQSGRYMEYYPNGKPMLLAIYQYGELHGDWTKYDSSGAVLIKAKYRDNQKNGFWINRRTKVQGRYRNNLKHGKWEYNVGTSAYYKRYYIDGKEVDQPSLSKRLAYLKDSWKGSVSEENGEVLVAPPLKEKVEDSLFIIKDGDTLIHKIRYISRDSIEHPTMRKAVFVDKPEQVAVKKYIYNGSLSGMYKAYYPNGALYQYANYSAGKLDGEWKEYSDDGILRVKGKYLDGKKQGKWEYNLRKKTYKKEVYRNGELKK
jgi:antitoxin component YwqK of YwqJK toxin-antitoxin module